MVAKLTAFRDKIAETEKALLELLVKGLDLAAAMGKVKSHHRLPIYMPERRVTCWH